MDKLLSIAGGQPLRSNDWVYIQDATEDVIREIINGLAGQVGAVIVKGCVVTTDETNTYISEGAVFDGDQIRHVPQANFTTQGAAQDNPGVGTWSLYLTPATTTEEQRTFKDDTQHNVWQHNAYTVGYAETVPEGSLAITGLDRLTDLITQRAVAAVPVPPAQVLSYLRKTISVGSMDQSQIVIPKAGAGKVIKIVSMTARIVPISTINADEQEIYVFYEDHADTPEIGSFPNNFLESPSPDICEMVPATAGRLYSNNDVRVALSTGDQPDSGSANVTFHVIYKIITL